MVMKQLYGGWNTTFYNIVSETNNYYVTTARCFIA